MSAINTVDKRLYPRRKLEMPICIKANGYTGKGQILNMSQSGALVYTETNFAINEKISFQININNSVLELNGKVVRTITNDFSMDKSYNIGIYFENLDTSVSQDLETVLKVKDVSNIAIFTLDCIYSTIAINKIVKTFPDKISLICLSIPYSKKKGSFLSQTVRNFKNSGVIFVLYLGLYLYMHNFFIKILRIFRRRSKKGLLSLRELALRYNIPTLITDDINGEKTVQLLKKIRPDLIISSHLDQRVSKDILDIPRYGAINLHYAKLPEFRGPFPSFWAMLQGRKSVGVSIHFMNEKFDEGDIIQQEDILVLPGDSIISIDSKLFDVGANLIISAIRKIELDVLTSVRQDLLGRNSYYSYPKRKEIKELSRTGRKIISLYHYFKALNWSFS